MILGSVKREQKAKISYNYVVKKAIILEKTNRSFPSKLKEIPDCPKKLFCRGNVEILNAKHLVAIVGSRRPTEYGLKETRKIARALASTGVVIISGLAMGIDAEAHKGALDAQGETIAVLGCAIDQIYPRMNEGLAQRIISGGGLVISEYKPGSETYKTNFVARNRIIAGLSQITLVTEAAEKSGALITAYLALDYNREVFALPGNINRLNSMGTNGLIKKGAACLTRAEDILDWLGISYNQAVNHSQLSFDELNIVKFLKEKKMSFDDLKDEAKLNPSDLNSILLMLEVKGIIENCEGDFALIGNIDKV